MKINAETLKVVICDDEIAVVRQLKELIEDFLHEMKISAYQIWTYLSGDKLDEDHVYADIALMDIELGRGLSGIHAGERLRRQNPDVVLIMVTGYPDYIDEAMGMQVFRYISKPINKGRLMRALRDAMKKIGESKRIVHFTTSQGGIVLNERDIIYLEGLRRKVIIYTLDGPIEVKENFQTCLKLLSGISFSQTHRSFLVNLRYVRSYDHLNVMLCADQGTEGNGNTNERTFLAYMSARNYLKSFKEDLVRFVEVNK